MDFKPTSKVKIEPVFGRMLNTRHDRTSISEDLTGSYDGVVLRNLTFRERYASAGYHAVISKVCSVISGFSWDVGMSAWDNLMNGSSHMSLTVTSLNVMAAVLPAGAISFGVLSATSAVNAFMSVAETKLVAIRGSSNNPNLRGVARAFNPDGLAHKSAKKIQSLVHKHMPFAALKPAG